MLQPERSSVTTKLPLSNIPAVHVMLHGEPAGSSKLGMVNCPSTSSPIVEFTVKVSCPSAKRTRLSNASGGVSTRISEAMVSDRVNTVPGAVKLMAAAKSASNINSSDSTTSGSSNQSSANVPENTSECTKASRPLSRLMTGTVSKLSVNTSNTSSKSKRVSTNGTATMGVQSGASNSSAGCSQPLMNSSVKTNTTPNIGVRYHGQENCCIPFILRCFAADVSQHQHIRINRHQVSHTRSLIA